MRSPTVLFGVAALVACGGAPPAPEPRPARPVVVAEVRRADLEAVVEAVGEARPVREATVAADGAGRVVAVAADGARVAPGEVVARLDATRVAAAAEAAAGRLAAAEAEAAQRRRDLERAERLHAAGVAPRQEVEHARTALEAAEAQAAALRAEERQAATALADRVVRAPFAGTVLERIVEVGEVVNPGAPVARIGDLSTLEVSAWVGEADAVRVRPGAEAVVSFDARPAETFAARVARVGDAVTAGARTGEVVVRVRNDAGLPAGLAARVRLVADRRSGVLVVERAAVRDGPEGAWVWVVEGGRARRRPVRLGTIGAERVEVVDGLAEGEAVIVRGGDVLVDGDAVEPSPLP